MPSGRKLPEMPERSSLPASPLPPWLRGAGPILAAGYSLGSTLHRKMTRPHFAPIATICVGNLSAGGTGKTPAVKYLARLLCDLGRRPAVLMRGYKEQASDEAREVTAALSDLRVPVLIGSDRLVSARKAAESGCDVALLDDGFQHWRLARDLDIVLVDATNPFGGGHLLPHGWLREKPEALGRAGVVILTRSDAVPASEREPFEQRLRALAPRALILSAAHKPIRVCSLSGASPEAVSTLAGQSVLAACGIGNPLGFQKTLESLGANMRDLVKFPDHHAYGAADIELLSKRAVESKASVILVTEKDAVKLTGLINERESKATQFKRLDVSFEICESVEKLKSPITAALVAGDIRRLADR